MTPSFVSVGRLVGHSRKDINAVLTAALPPVAAPHIAWSLSLSKKKPLVGWFVYRQEQIKQIVNCSPLERLEL
jgi:hypothetical protein